MARQAAQPHVYQDADVTLARLDVFATDTRANQVAALATLRGQQIDDSASVKLGLTSLVVATLLVVAGPLFTIDAEGPFRTNPLLAIAGVLVVGLVLIVGFTPAIIDSVRGHNRRERATIWLGAFQDELARRHRLPGRAGRLWRREH